MARALEIDAAHRFANADELREALSAGAAGQTFADETPTAGTAVMGGDETLATRVGTPVTEYPPGARRLQPSPGPATGYPAGAGAAAPERPARGRRALATFLLLALSAAVAVAIYFALTSGGDGVELREVTYDDVPESVEAMKELVDDNTR